VRPRRHWPALLGGPSTSPLDGMLGVSVYPMRRTFLLAFALLLWYGVATSQDSNPKQTDIPMLLQNHAGPFVTADFARQLGVLIMAQKYPGVIFDAAGVEVLDKGDVWWVTVPIQEWPIGIPTLKPLPAHLIFWIRKADAAVLDIRSR